MPLSSIIVKAQYNDVHDNWSSSFMNMCFAFIIEVVPKKFCKVFR